MKILVLSDYFKDYRENRASFRVRHQTSLKMAKLGHDIHFVYPGSGIVGRKNRINPRLLEQSTPGLLPMRFRVGGFGFLDMIVKSLIVLLGTYDVIHVTNGHRPSQFIPCLLGKFLKQAFVVDECWEWLGRGGYSDRRRGFLGKLVGAYDGYLEFPFKRIFDHIVVISEALAERFTDRDRVTVLNGGAETEELVAYDIDESRNALGLPKDGFLIGMSNIIAADHSDNKVCFEAVSSMVTRHDNLWLLATSANTEYIHSIGREYGLSHRLISPGYVPFAEYNRYLSSCNVFVLPYRDDPVNRGRWPNRLGDYLCLCRPIITNATGDVAQLFYAYKVGLLCDFSPDGFCRAIKEMIDNAVLAQDYARDSRCVAEEILSFEGRVRRILGIFQCLRNSKRDIRTGFVS